MDTLVIVILAVIVTVGVMSGGFIIFQARKNGETQIPWEKIRPILSEMFIEVITLIQAKSSGYQAVEDYAVTFVKRKIDQADFLLPEEKEILTEDFIRSVIAPRLKELYSKEIGQQSLR